MRDFSILVADNNQETLDVIERMFSYFKLKVSSCTSATSALEGLHYSHIKTLIINIDLQDMVGLELAHRAHEINSDLNIVLYIGNSTDQLMKLTLAPTVSDISEIPLKPYSFSQMLLDIKSGETGKIYLLE